MNTKNVHIIYSLSFTQKRYLLLMMIWNIQRVDGPRLKNCFFLKRSEITKRIFWTCFWGFNSYCDERVIQLFLATFICRIFFQFHKENSLYFALTRKMYFIQEMCSYEIINIWIRIHILNLNFIRIYTH